MKKLLSTLMAFGVIASSTMTVVACGPVTKTKLMNRSIDTSVFKGTFKFPMTTWSHLSTQQAEDAIILTQLQDTLLTPNRYNEFEGSLAYDWNWDSEKLVWEFDMKTSELASKLNSEGIKINPAVWTGKNDPKGDYIKQHEIGTDGMLDAYRFIFNPNNLSAATAAWSSVILGGVQLVDFIDKLIIGTPELFDKSYDSKNSNITQDMQRVISTKAIDVAIAYFNMYVDESVDISKRGNIEIKTPDELDWTTETTVVEDKTIVGYKLTSKSQTWLQSLIEDKKIESTGETDENMYNAYINRAKSEGKVIKAAENGYTLRMALQNPSPYFESIAAFNTWAPVPPKAVDYNKAGSSSYHYGESPDNIWYSGAYVIDSYAPTRKIELSQNPYYYEEKYFEEENSIKKQIYYYMGSADVSKPRLLFEAGDISEVELSPTDSSGWNRYVGSDIQNPAFEGTHPVKKPNSGTWFLMYNFGRLDDKGTWTPESKALHLTSVRKLIGYVMNRSHLASFYSKAMDGESNEVDKLGNRTSKLVRNTYTSEGFIPYGDDNNKRDYALDDIGETYNKVFTSNETQPETKVNEESIIRDGYDMYRFNDDIIIGDQAHFFGETAQDIELENEFKKLANPEVETLENVNAKISILTEKVANDLYALIGKKSITLEILTNGNTKTTINRSIQNMIDDFNKMVNADGKQVIQIIEKTTTDAASYRTQSEQGNFDLYTGGWSPDYTDPYNFLHTIIYNGEYNNYQALTKVIEPISNDQSKLRGDEPTLRYKAQKTTGMTSEQIGILNDNLLAPLDNYTQNVSAANLIGTPADRYKAFAAAEVEAVINRQFILPTYSQRDAETMYLSYTDPFTRAAYPSGASQYRLFGVLMSERLLTNEQFIKRKEEHQDQIDNPDKKVHYFTYQTDRPDPNEPTI
ncbi:oligopeptide ABC transporter substrate-binding protein OppA [Mesoplasma photuris]|uniref:oligopeptide ABC transporter substrate-binding protein OppA n=1 Tax=Mesoplasma photuris TaxID=217731 RepID=UPI0004E22EAC|nr:oligopeptide ABC transporter substrate-binding protein OppA [Mesoplasma photuris]